jgi:BON domain-containing protein
MKNYASLLRLLFTGFLAGLMSLTWGASGALAVGVTNPNGSAIANQVQHELAMLPWYGVFDHLSFQVNGSEVILNGQVISEHGTTKDDAEKFVKSIHGVTKVVNNIEVLPPSPFDNQIRRAEYRAVFSQADLGRYTLGAIPQVHIIVKNGHVSLEGVVMNQMDKNTAGIVANTVPGVFSVQNHLQVAS